MPAPDDGDGPVVVGDDAAAQTRYKRPESVLVLIYTRAGEVLLLQRRQPAGYWQSVTGSLLWGETAAAAAVREVREETGLDVRERLVDCGYHNRFAIVAPWRARYAPDQTTNYEYVFRVEYTTRPVIRLNLSEHTRHAWWSAREARARVSSPTNREAIERFLGDE